MITFLRWVWFLGVFIALFVGLTALFNWKYDEHRPLWTGVVLGLVMVAGTLLMSYSERRGWIKGVFWNREEEKRRQKELADERERILAEAKSKPRA